MKHFNLSSWAVSHPTLILFLMIILGVAGYFSYQKLGRAEDPYFTVKVVNVSAIWPGATAQEMQTQVADPIEKKLQELPFFEKVQTYSKPAFTAMQVTFRDSTSPKDVPYLFYLLRVVQVFWTGDKGHPLELRNGFLQKLQSFSA